MCFRKYLTRGAILYLSDLSWLSYKLLFVRHAPKLHYPPWKTISWKELSPWGQFFFSLITDWQHSLSLSPCLSLFVSVPLSPFSVPPTPHSAVCLDQTAPASISDFQSIPATALLTDVCLSVSFQSLQSIHWWREWTLTPWGTRHDNVHHLVMSLNSTFWPVWSICTVWVYYTSILVKSLKIHLKAYVSNYLRCRVNSSVTGLFI